MHGGAISLRTRSGKTRPNRPASSQGLPEGGTITTPPYNAPMVGGAFPVAANLAPVREVPLLADQRRCERSRVSAETILSNSSRALRTTALAFLTSSARSAWVSCLRRTRFGADRAGGTQERDARPQDVRDDSDDCSRQLLHALIMPDLACVCGCPTRKCRRRELLRATTVTRACWGIHPVFASSPAQVDNAVILPPTRRSYFWTARDGEIGTRCSGANRPAYNIQSRPHRGQADDLSSVILNVDQDTLLLTNRVPINRCVDIHGPASVENELQLFVRHFEDVSAV
jgi:hypothetical protein